MPVNIVLVEPEIPQNTGNIIRTCACTGAVLHLVRPLGFSMSEKHLRRAGLDYADLAEIRYYDSFWELFDSKNVQEQQSFYFFTTKTEKNHVQVRYSSESYLVFGAETRGLSEEIRSLIPKNNLRIPMKAQERVRSLNLSNAVAVAVYEVIRQNDYPFLK